MIRLCLLLFIIVIIFFFWKSVYVCNFYVDCKMIEFCYFFIGMWSWDKFRGFGLNNNLKFVFGVCIVWVLKDVFEDLSLFFLNCSYVVDCGKGRCCLKDLGLCVGYCLFGEFCVVEVSLEIGVVNFFLVFLGKWFYVWFIWLFYLLFCLNILNVFYNMFYLFLVFFCEMMFY